MAESFGTRLRKERERRRIALTSIVEDTKISLSLLEGLERDDVSHWPSGIFRRAFIRAYAQRIGLESSAVVHEFLNLYPDPDDETAILGASPGTDVQSGSEQPPTRLQFFISSAIRSRAGLNSEVVQRLGSTIRSVIGASVVPGMAAPEADADASVAPATAAPEAAAGASVVPGMAAPEAAADASVAPATAAPEPAPDLSAAAHVCTQLGRVLETREVPPLLEGAAKVLDAAGLVVWVSNGPGTRLRPALTYGYSDELLAQLPSIRSDADNATATAFRSAQTRIVNSSDLANGAVVIPLMTPSGCVGVLAAELRHRGEHSESVRALATIFAAQLATLVAVDPVAGAMQAQA
jgi:transcriptional regulator with XRE-family HTH domain